MKHHKEHHKEHRKEHMSHKERGKHHVDGEVDYGKHPGPFHGSPVESHTFGHGGHLGGYKTRPISQTMHPGRAAEKIKPHLEGGQFEGGNKTRAKEKMNMSPRGMEEDD